MMPVFRSMFALLALLTVPAAAQQAGPVQVLIVGFTHLSQLNSGATPVDVLQPIHQQSLAQLRKALGAFKPDAVMVEVEPKEQVELSRKYRAFCGSEHRLPKDGVRDETVQVAFPMACSQQLDEVTAINYYDSTPQAMLASGENIERYQAGLRELQGFARPLNQQVAEGKLSVFELIRAINAPDKIELSHRLIFNTPAYVRDGDFHEPPANIDMSRVDKHYIGVEFIERFYNRNLRIYSNILQAQQRLGARRILITLGQTHVGVLQELLRHNPNFQVVEAGTYLK